MERTLRSKINENFSVDLLKALERVCNDVTIPDNNTKVGMVKDILNIFHVQYNMLGPGTNRVAVLIDGTVFKIALDSWGKRDNLNEYAMTVELQPYVIKVYEVNTTGVVMACEYVTVISKEEYDENKEEILSILEDLSQEYLLGDVGYIKKNYLNWGYTDKGDLVILDFAYIYKIIGNELLCNNPECAGKPYLVYNSTYSSLYCPHCKRTYSFMDIRRRYNREDEERFIKQTKELSYKTTEKSLVITIPDNEVVIDGSSEENTEKVEEDMSMDAIMNRYYDGNYVPMDLEHRFMTEEELNFTPSYFESVKRKYMNKEEVKSEDIHEVAQAQEPDIEEEFEEEDNYDYEMSWEDAYDSVIEQLQGKPLENVEPQYPNKKSTLGKALKRQHVLPKEEEYEYKSYEEEYGEDKEEPNSFETYETYAQKGTVAYELAQLAKKNKKKEERKQEKSDNSNNFTYSRVANDDTVAGRLNKYKREAEAKEAAKAVTRGNNIKVTKPSDYQESKSDKTSNKKRVEENNDAVEEIITVRRHAKKQEPKVEETFVENNEEKVVVEPVITQESKIEEIFEEKIVESNEEKVVVEPVEHEVEIEETSKETKVEEVKEEELTEEVHVDSECIESIIKTRLKEAKKPIHIKPDESEKPLIPPKPPEMVEMEHVDININLSLEDDIADVIREIQDEEEAAEKARIEEEMKKMNDDSEKILSSTIKRMTKSAEENEMPIIVTMPEEVKETDSVLDDILNDIVEETEEEQVEETEVEEVDSQEAVHLNEPIEVEAEENEEEPMEELSESKEDEIMKLLMNQSEEDGIEDEAPKEEMVKTSETDDGVIAVSTSVEKMEKGISFSLKGEETSEGPTSPIKVTVPEGYEEETDMMKMIKELRGD